MKTRGGKVIFLGAALAIMAFVVVYVVMSKGLVGGTATNDQTASVPETPRLVSIASVNRDVPAYTVLDASTVATVDVEASTVASNTTTEPTSLYGKMTLVPLTKGQPVRVDQITQTGFSDILAKGERAFSLAVPERSTFGNAVTENDRVDLLWTVVLHYTVQAPGADGKPVPTDNYFTSTKTLLQNVHVLRVITLIQAPPTGQNGQASPASTNTSSTGNAEPVSATSTSGSTLASMYAPEAPYQTVMVLGVTDQQAEVITYARANGQIDLTLRSSAVQKDDAGNVVKDDKGKDLRGDTEIEKTTGICLCTLIQQYGLPAPKDYPNQQP
jgi:Flp pilus assembly protein CpaB